MILRGTYTIFDVHFLHPFAHNTVHGPAITTFLHTITHPSLYKVLRPYFNIQLGLTRRLRSRSISCIIATGSPVEWPGFTLSSSSSPEPAHLILCPPLNPVWPVYMEAGPLRRERRRRCRSITPIFQSSGSFLVTQLPLFQSYGQQFADSSRAD